VDLLAEPLGTRAAAAAAAAAAVVDTACAVAAGGAAAAAGAAASAAAAAVSCAAVAASARSFASLLELSYTPLCEATALLTRLVSLQSNTAGLKSVQVRLQTRSESAAVLSELLRAVRGYACAPRVGV
jgi:hypothetical protein